MDTETRFSKHPRKIKRQDKKVSNKSTGGGISSNMQLVCGTPGHWKFSEVIQGFMKLRK